MATFRYLYWKKGDYSRFYQIDRVFTPHWTLKITEYSKSPIGRLNFDVQHHLNSREIKITVKTLYNLGEICWNRIKLLSIQIIPQKMENLSWICFCTHNTFNAFYNINRWFNWIYFGGQKSILHKYLPYKSIEKNEHEWEWSTKAWSFFFRDECSINWTSCMLVLWTESSIDHNKFKQFQSIGLASSCSCEFFPSFYLGSYHSHEWKSRPRSISIYYFIVMNLWICMRIFFFSCKWMDMVISVMRIVTIRTIESTISMRLIEVFFWLNSIKLQ